MKVLATWRIGRLNIQPFLAWFDLWFGGYINPDTHNVYIGVPFILVRFWLTGGRQ